MYFSVIHNSIVTHYMYNFTLFSREKRVKFEMLSLFSRNEKWNEFWFHSFREVKFKCLEIEIERWNCKIILEKQDSCRLLTCACPFHNLFRSLHCIANCITEITFFLVYFGFSPSLWIAAMWRPNIICLDNRHAQKDT